MDYVHRSFNFIVQVGALTLYQFFLLFGFGLIFGLLLYFISRSTRMAFSNSGHAKLDIYFTGWIGTPVHETGHAIFCILFGHRINDIKLYSPNSQDGTLGYVNHSFNPQSIYQRIGCFFIGTGPILFGSFVIYMLLSFCLPNGRLVSEIISNTDLSGSGIFELVKSSGSIFAIALSLMVTVFAPENFSEPSFWIFIYLSFCISSHMQLSPSDLKSMWSGMFTILIIVLLVNSLLILLEINATPYIQKFSRLTEGATIVFILATVISLTNFLVTYLILAAFHYKKHRNILSIW